MKFRLARRLERLQLIVELYSPQIFQKTGTYSCTKQYSLLHNASTAAQMTPNRLVLGHRAVDNTSSNAAAWTDATSSAYPIRSRWPLKEG